ncbi:MAG: heme-degrading domain-containing protein [Pseudomonadota bacterium]
MAEHDDLLAALLKQEQDLQFDAFSADTALQLGLQLVAEAKARGQGVTVDIRRNGQLLFHHAMAGTSPDNAEWVRRKNNVAQRFGHSSFYVGTQFRARGTTFEAHLGLDPHEYKAHGGAFPLLLRGTGMVGTITVSGLPEAQDHALVVGALQTMLA